MNDQRTAVRSAAITYGSFAVPISMVGVYWPEVQTEFGQTIGALGWVSIAYGAARMSTATAGRAMLRRLAMGPAFVVALTCLAAATLVLAAAPSWTLFLVAVAAVGVTSGLLDSLGAMFITSIGDVGSAGLIHGMYGFGATAGPLIVILAPSWRWSALAAFALVLLATAVAFTAKSTWPALVSTSRHPPADSQPVGSAIILASLGAFAALVAFEVTAGQWAFTYLTESRSVDDTLAAIGVSGFWAGLMIGRLLMSRPTVTHLIDKLGTVTFTLVALSALGGVAVLPSTVAVGALMVVGLFLGPLIPTLFARTLERVGEAHAARMAGRQLLATNVGAITVPALTGVLVDAIGAGAIIAVALVVLGGVSLPLLAILRRIAPV